MNYKADYWDFKFATCECSELETLFKTVKNYANSLPSEKWLTLTGASGIGKTHLARQLIKFWNKWHVLQNNRCRYAHFIEWAKFLDEMRTSFGSNKIKELQDVGLLVIDDIGAENITDWASEKLLILLNARRNKPTVITTNLRINEINETNTRIASRLIDGGIIKNTVTGNFNNRPGVNIPQLPPPEPQQETAEPELADLTQLSGKLLELAKSIEKKLNVTH